MNRLATIITFLAVLSVGIGLYGIQNNGFPFDPAALWDVFILFIPLSVLAAIMIGFGFHNGVQD